MSTSHDENEGRLTRAPYHIENEEHGPNDNVHYNYNVHYNGNVYQDMSCMLCYKLLCYTNNRRYTYRAPDGIVNQ